MLNLFQHPTREAYALHGGYLSCGIPKQVREDILLYYVMLNLFQHPIC
jgi:hypothetical protein